MLPDDPNLVDELVAKLSSSAAVERTSARERLIEIGTEAVPAVLPALTAEQQHVRWEAAKTLQGIADPSAAAQLVEALGDDDPDVRWVAGEALAAIGRDALEPLFEGLTKSRDSEGVYKAARHVLRQLAKNKKVADVIHPVLEAFHRSEPEVSVPLAASKALEKLR